MSNVALDVSKQTLASSAYFQLREDILTGSIAPEAKLNIRELCDRFATGLSPIREALSRLSSEGLVQQSDNRGFRVMPVSVAELLDMTKARSWINEVGLRQSIRQGGSSWEEEVLVSFHHLRRTPRYIDGSKVERSAAWEDAHRRFHRSLIAGCGSRWLIDTCERYFDAAERYRHLSRIAGVSRGRHEQEHDAITHATLERQADAAVDLLTAHFQRTADLVQKVLGSMAPARSKTRRVGTN